MSRPASKLSAGALHVREQLPRRQGDVFYRTLWNAFKRLAEGATEAERVALFSGTAAPHLWPADPRGTEARPMANRAEHLLRWPPKARRPRH
jgi:hypothetical protein